MNPEIEFSCPYCGEINFTTVFFPEGKSSNSFRIVKSVADR